MKGFHRGLELFGQHRLREASNAEVLKALGLVIVEGPNDAIRLDALGIPSVALCSNTITREQAEKAARLARELAGGIVMVFLDCDAEGENGMKQCLGYLAMRGFEERMVELHDFSKRRAEKLKPIVETLDQRENQPLELECALEVARVTADLVHTLFTLGLKPTAMPGAILEGKLNGSPPTGYAAVPVKVVIEGTDYSTTADAEGRYRFHSLPPGRYAIWIIATGYEAERVKDVLLKAGETTVLETKLKHDLVAGNLVRNPRFAVRWTLPNQPDGWTRDPAKPGRWASAPIRVPVGQACSVRITFAGDSRPGVSIRWRTNPSSLSDSREVSLDPAKSPTEILPDPALKPFEKGLLFLEVLLHTDRSPEEAFRHVAVAFAEK